MNRSNGREAFNRYEPILTLISRLLSRTPALLKVFLWRIFDNTEGKLSAAVRYCVISSTAKTCGKNVFIGRNVTLKNVDRLSIGNNVSIHAGSYIDAYGGLQIGDDVSIANQTSIISFEHTWNDTRLPIKYNPIKSSGIKIDSDVWIGSGARILDGTHICRRVVIAAGAVARGHIAPDAVYGGIPAKKIKSLSADPE